MPSASHRWCKRCHKVRVDKRAGLEMCQRCKRITMSERQSERRAIRARKALRQQAMGVAEMPLEPKPEPSPPSSSPPLPTEAPTTNGVVSVGRFSDERKLEIASAYADYNVPTREIVKHFGISNGDLVKVADELNVPRRDKRNVGRSLPDGRWEGHSWVTDQPSPPVPEPVERALERMLAPAPEPIVKPRRVEPAEPPRPSVTVNSSTQVWEVSVTGLIHVTGDEIEDALAAVKGIYPKLRVTGIRQA